MTTSPVSGVSMNYTANTPITPIAGFSTKKASPDLKNIFEAASRIIQPKSEQNQIVQPAFSASAQGVFNGFNVGTPKGENFTAVG